jgi:hypothetical protein
VIECINDLFTREAKKGGKVCAIKSSIMTINFAEALEIEPVCKVEKILNQLFSLQRRERRIYFWAMVIGGEGLTGLVYPLLGRKR